jgi:pimeloyl-ACP methyl ester carboxylesterase
MHRLGIDEPRLINFARGLASAGIIAYTPELPALQDYTIAAESVDAIGLAARQLSGGLRRAVGVWGLSFAGSLALLAAADPRYSGRIGFVVAMGAYDDLSRVTRFFVKNRIERAEGGMLPLQAHEYGALVLIYSHVESFFSPADVLIARAAIRAMLWEDSEGAKTLAQGLSAAGRARVEALLHQERTSLAESLLAVIEAQHAAMTLVSPSGKLGTIHVPLYFLHGSSDNVIPPTETEWLVRDAPKKWVRAGLISDAIGHVDVKGRLSRVEEWNLLHFMARLLSEAETEAEVQ